ncbi:periphilin-1 [Bombina bombina]|uniref:periphilin-1 n=1 Tax=Bombina bombina TaxID=8345 RepID=UPI00235B0286|nr:periphilin-1 [Bombina bombina]
MDFRKDDMWVDGRYEYERLPRHRLPPREMPPDDDYHRVVNIVQRRPEEDEYNAYDDYGDPDYRDYELPQGYGSDRRRGTPYRGDDTGYRWPRGGESHMNRHSEYRQTREGFRRKPIYPPGAYARERSPHKREYFRESPHSRKESPHSRSGSSVSSRSYSPERGKHFSSHQHSKSKERTIPLKSPKDLSPSSSAAIPPTKGTELEKSSSLSDIALVEAACRLVAEKIEKASESNLPELANEFAVQSSEMYEDQSADIEAHTSGNSEVFEITPHSSRTKAIATKTKEIEEVYRQDCETFGMVVKMLIDKDPALEKSIQYSLRQNLSEIGERCIEELKMYIAEYDVAHQELP